MPKEEIWIIGTDPPCPRCDYLTRMTHTVVNESGHVIKVKHLSYTDVEAKDLAHSLGLTPGTAKNVAQKVTVDIDWEQVYRLIDHPPISDTASTANACCGTASAKWTPELDDALRPCEQAAAAAGILMTPVLVVGGQVKHQGSVPTISQVRQWVAEAYGKKTTTADEKIIVEVLGPGCKNCDTLYDNVFLAMGAANFKEKFVVKKISDVNYFAKMGVHITPGFIVDGEVISKGKVLTPDQIYEHLQTATRSA
ncbi:MAG: thioredoxin family protein [Desulfobacterales bacterium]|nr:thioredoxin family protein [Desulfobacterales bacterium]